jgi:hypothetical protein
VQQEWEWAEKEAELDEKEAEYIRQVNAKEIDKSRFRELVAKLDMESDGGECSRRASHNAGDHSG